MNPACVPRTGNNGHPAATICRRFVIGDEVMKARWFLCSVVCAMIASLALAGGPDMQQKFSNACKFGGAWLGHSAGGPWTAVMVENTHQNGTAVIDWGGGTGDFFGICPGSVAISNCLGVWERTGPRSFSFSGISFSIDADGNPVCIWKNSGWGEFDPGCRTGWLNATLEFFAPDANPFEDEPYYNVPPGDDHLFLVMTVDPPAE